MSQPRLASSVLVSALLRRVGSEGGFGAVIAKGDETAGAVLIVLAERGRRVRVLERLLRPDGSYGWADPLGTARNEVDLDKFLEQRRRFDPDSWIIELDTASAERFAAEMTGAD